MVECESVGVSYLAPASIYRQGDAVPRYFPTPFTEHFPVVHAAKYALGLRVVTDTSIRVFQAWLPHWGTGLESYNPPFDDTRAEWPFIERTCLSCAASQRVVAPWLVPMAMCVPPSWIQSSEQT